MLLPLGVQVAGLVIGHVLSRQHLLVDPEFQLDHTQGRDGQRQSTFQREGRVRRKVGEGEAGVAVGVGRSRAGVRMLR